MVALWLALAMAFAAAGFWVLWRSRQRRLEGGLPPGQIVYSDTGAWQRCDESFFSVKYGLAGRPDYVVREHGRLIPVEVKPGRDASEPYAGDILQLAAYCLLVEEQTQQRPPHGYLRYRTSTFRLDWSGALKARLLRQLEQMRVDLDAGDLLPNHTEARRCLRCGHRDHCQRPIG